MSPQPWFLVAGVLFIVAVIGGLVLLAVVALLALRAGPLAIALDRHRLNADRDADNNQPDPAAALGQLLADLAAHHQRQQCACDIHPRFALIGPSGE